MTTEEYVFSPANLARVAAMWDNAPTEFLPGQGGDLPVDEPNDDEATRELSDHEYDVLANNAERNWV